MENPASLVLLLRNCSGVDFNKKNSNITSKKTLFQMPIPIRKYVNLQWSLVSRLKKFQQEPNSVRAYQERGFLLPT